MAVAKTFGRHTKCEHPQLSILFLLFFFIHLPSAQTDEIADRSVSAIQSCRPPPHHPRARPARPISGTTYPTNSLSSADLHDFDSFLCPSSFQEPATLNPHDPYFPTLLPPDNSISHDTGIYPSSLSTFPSPSPQATDQYYADIPTTLPTDLNPNLPYDHFVQPSFATTTAPPLALDQAPLDPIDLNQPSWLDFASNQLDFNQYSFPTTSESLNSSSLDTPQSSSPNSLLQNSFPSTSFNYTAGNGTEPTPLGHVELPASAPPTTTGSTEDSANEQPQAVDEAAEKRRRNTLAARRFRKKQQDRVTKLESALDKVTKERDELKMRAARWEGEVSALRKMLAEQKKN